MAFKLKQKRTNASTGVSEFFEVPIAATTDANGNPIEDTYARLQGESVIYIEGTGTTVGTWIGTSSRITSYYTGLAIWYKIPIGGASTTTLNINNLGAKTVYRNNDSNIGSTYPVGTIVPLVYDAQANNNSGGWKTSESPLIGVTQSNGLGLSSSGMVYLSPATTITSTSNVPPTSSAVYNALSNINSSISNAWANGTVIGNHSGQDASLRTLPYSYSAYYDFGIGLEENHYGGNIYLAVNAMGGPASFIKLSGSPPSYSVTRVNIPLSLNTTLATVADLANYQTKLNTTSVGAGTLANSIGFDASGNLVRGEAPSSGANIYKHRILLQVSSPINFFVSTDTYSTDPNSVTNNSITAIGTAASVVTPLLTVNNSNLGANYFSVGGGVVGTIGSPTGITGNTNAITATIGIVPNSSSIYIEGIYWNANAGAITQFNSPVVNCVDYVSSQI